MLITAAYPFSNTQVYSISHSFRNQRAASHTFARSHCPSHNLWASSSSPFSPVTRQHPILESSVRSSITDTNIIMDEPWQSFKIDYDSDALETDYDNNPLKMDYDLDDSDYDTLIPLPENPRIKRLRRDKGHGLAPPYCATAPALFPRNTHPDDIELGLELRLHKPTPLRNIALSNVPKWPITGALENSLPCPLAPPPPPPGKIRYGRRCKHGIDRVTIPKRRSSLVRHDWFDKQQAIHNKCHDSEGSPESTRRHWSQDERGKWSDSGREIQS
jgi:hypothetical protein